MHLVHGKSTSFIIPNALKIADQEKKIKEATNIIEQGKNVVFTDPKGELYGITSQMFKEHGYDVKVFNLVNPEHSDGIDLIKFIDKEVDAQVFAQVVISTTQNAGDKGEEFWQNTQENLLKALLLHIKFEVEDNNKKNMRYLNSILASGNISKIDEVFEHSRGITKMAYNLYAQASEQIKQSTITGLATKLQIFQLSEIVLFIKTIRQADSNPTKELNRKLCIFLDEFPNIGQIPDFQKKLSTIRSRGISATIVCQHIAGLKSIYPNDIWQGLIGNTDIKIIMGTNDLLTADYISQMLGIATVETSSIRKEAAFDGKMKYGVESTSSVGRYVLNKDEIMRLDNDIQIIIIRGYKAFKCKKLRYWEYRLGSNLKQSSVEDYNPENVVKLNPIIEEKKEDKLPTFEEFLRGRRK